MILKKGIFQLFSIMVIFIAGTANLNAQENRIDIREEGNEWEPRTNDFVLQYKSGNP